MPKQDQKKDRKQAAESAVEQLQSRFGEGSIMKLGEAKKMKVDVIPTGCLSLDLALGVGGIPRGRVIEIFGLEMTGKSTMALHIIAEAQKKGGIAAFVDAEHALDPEYAKRIGVNVNDLLISQPDTGEQALEIVETLVRSNGVDVIVIDSVAALTPQKEIEGEMGDQQIGLQARLMSKACLAGDTELVDPLTGEISIIDEIVDKKLPWNSLTFDENTGRFIISEVTDWLPQGKRNCFKIRTKDGHVLKLTEDHLVYTLNGWKEVKDLTYDDCLAIPRRVPEPKVSEKKLSDGDIKIIAYIIGDGNFTASNYGLSFVNIDQEIIDDLNTSLNKLDCELYKTSYKDYRVRKKEYLPRGSYRSPAKELLKSVGLYGKKSPQKDIPREIFQLSKRQLSIFISRLWSCDGHVDISARAIIYSSSSLKLIKQLQFLLLRFGIVSRWRQKRFGRHLLYVLTIQSESNIEAFAGQIGLVGDKHKKLNGIDKQKRKSKVVPFEDTFPYQLVPQVKEMVYVSGHNGQEISHLFGLTNRTSFPEFKPGRLRLSRDHLEKIADFIDNTGLKKMTETDVYWSNIESIISIGQKKVYDLTIKGIPNFVANGVLVHNCRKLTNIVSKTKTSVIFINQIRMKIGIMFGNPETTTGGLALKFYSSVRIELRRLAQIKKSDEVIGNRVKAKVVKNKVAPPFKVAEFEIMYDEGISYTGDLLNLGAKHGLVIKKGNTLYYEKEKLGVGWENAKNYLKENPKIAINLKKQILQALK